MDSKWRCVLSFAGTQTCGLDTRTGSPSPSPSLSPSPSPSLSPSPSRVPEPFQESWGRCIDEGCISCVHHWWSWARVWVVAKLFPVSTTGGHGQGSGSWQSSYLSPPLMVMGKGLGHGKALPCLHHWWSWARVWVVAKLLPVSTSDGHGQGLGSWQSSSLSPPLVVMGKGLGRGKALTCPLCNDVRPFFFLPVPCSSTLNRTLEDGLR